MATGLAQKPHPTVRIGARRVPVVLPSIRDPRLHLAAVIITVHILGQTVLGFRVSVPQIVVSILTCAVMEVFVAFRRSGQLVWPASAMLTGSGVALILRLVEAERWQPWSWEGWYIFAGVAAVSLGSKYVLRRQGTHLFNPSNFGLVLAFLVLGSDVIEPLDFWWGPWSWGLVAAYAVILGGGIAITRRLHLLTMGAVFWLVLAGSLALLAASGHCMTTAWSLTPVCGVDFWTVVVISPEVLIFLFFMITDPKTIPSGPAGRIFFAVGIAAAATLLMAPQTTEFGAKVGLLAGLAVMSPLRSLFDRVFGAERVWHRLTSVRPAREFGRGVVLGAGLVAFALAVVLAGAPAQQSVRAAVDAPPNELDIEVEAAALPVVVMDESVMALNNEVGSSDGSELALALAQNLAIEAEARRLSDPSLLRAADHGARLLALEHLIEDDAVARRRVVVSYAFDSLRLRAIYGANAQLGASLGFDANGTLEEVTYDEGGVEQSRQTLPFSTTFVLNQATGDRWLIVEEQGLD